ncbi:DUF6870 family protein [Anaerotruncus rubiinfantis]|uniref:DUF6870 family protein n=1 Tax=Anaerotruncus rubiinfantis TaxID=1720200 RepID=UPI0034A1AA6C
MKNEPFGGPPARELPELSDLAVDQSLPCPERIARFVGQAGDPYRYRCGSVSVGLEFLPDGPSLQERMEGFLIAKKQNLE